MRFILATLLLILAGSAASAQGLTINAQIHNAPGWRRSHSYAYTPGPPTAPFTRVNAGAGWDPGGAAYTSGLEVNNYQLIAPTVGSCTSASTGPGPSGTGSSISDGTCTWKYTSVVDYVSVTGWGFDSQNLWSNGTTYGLKDVVVAGANLDVYQQQMAGCVSTVLPTDKSGSAFNTADGCQWVYHATVTYSSRTKPFPHPRFKWDSFQGYIAPVTTNITGSVASGNILTVTATSGTIAIKAQISAIGMSAGNSIYDQISGTPGGIGTYHLTNFESDISSEGMLVTYGLLTITTPPATWPLTLSNPDVVGNQAMGTTNAGRAAGDGYAGTIIVSGSGLSWLVNIPQTIGSAGSPVTFYHSWAGGGAPASQVVQSIDFYHGQLWNDREYVGGDTANNEINPLQVWAHNYEYNDATAVESLPPASSYNPRWGYRFYLEAAPGEGFKDTFNANPTLPLGGYNENNGASLRGVGVPAYEIWDNIAVVQGLQLTSDKQTVFALPARSCNACLFQDNIVESGTGGPYSNQTGTFGACGAQCIWFNNLIIVRGTLGVSADYGGQFLYNTFYCATGTCFAAMSNTRDWGNFDGMVMWNNAVFGFLHVTSTDRYNNCDGTCNPTFPPLNCYWDCSTIQGNNNATDLSAADGADYPNSYTTENSGLYVWAMPFTTGSQFISNVSGLPIPLCGSYVVGTTEPVPATCGIVRNVDPNAAFVSYPTNLKPKSGGPLIGAGALFDECSLIGFDGLGAGTVSWNITTTACSGDTPLANGLDLFGNARPVSGHYDIGAVEFGGAGPVISLPGRFLFR